MYCMGRGLVERIDVVSHGRRSTDRNGLGVDLTMGSIERAMFDCSRVVDGGNGRPQGRRSNLEVDCGKTMFGSDGSTEEHCTRLILDVL
jgi:hypothetical protein